MHIDRTNAERQRRYRKRRDGNLCVATVELPYSVIVRMGEQGILPEGAMSDPVARAQAIEQYLIKQFTPKFCYPVTG